MLKRVGRMVVLMGLLVALLVGCGQPASQEQAPGEPGVNVSPATVPDEPGVDVSPATVPTGQAVPDIPPPSPEASPEADS